MRHPYFRRGDRIHVRRPRTWLDGQLGTVLDVLGIGGQAAVAVELDREFGEHRRVLVLRACQLREHHPEGLTDERRAAP